MSKYADITIDSEVELPNGKTIGKIEELHLPIEPSTGGWPAYLPVPSSEGYGHFVYITQSFSFASGPLPWDGLYWGNPVARGKLTIGDTYLVGTAQGNVECVCFDNCGFPTIGKSDDDMQETGDWQICEDSGEIYCGVVGLENDVFNFTIANLPLAVPVKIDEEFLPEAGGDAEVTIFTAYLDEDYLCLNDGKTAGDIGTAFDNNIGRVFIEEDGVLYLVMANPATYSGKFAMSPEYSLTSYAHPGNSAFNKIGH